MKSVAILLRENRRHAGLTQAQLAAAAGTSQPTINDYEQGRKVPAIPTLERLLRACGRNLVMATKPLGKTVEAPPSSVRAQLGPGARRLRQRRRQLLEAARAHGARNVRVFGSVARGEEDATRDVDLLVDLAPGRTLLDLAGLREDAREILGGRVDVATPEILKPRIRERALREAVPL